MNAVTVTVELFAEVGVPEIVPFEAFKVSPCGKVPDVKTKLFAKTGEIDGIELKLIPKYPFVLLYVNVVVELELPELILNIIVAVPTLLVIVLLV